MDVFEKNSNIFKLLSEAISEGIVVVNGAGAIVATNQRLNHMFGYKEEELLGNQLHMLIPERFHARHGHHVASFQNQPEERRMGEGRILFGRRKNQQEFPIEVGLTPFSLYGQQYVMALADDITEYRKKEVEIEELNAHLEQKIKRRTTELRNTVAELKREIKKREAAEAQIKDALAKEKELNELKTKFLSLVSHEFKTPLSGILTSATLVGKYTTTEQQDKRDKHLRTIKAEVGHLNNILTDFLSIERLETGRESYKLKDFSLSKVINEVLYNANMMLKNGQRILYPQNIDDITICQDEKMVTLCLMNLLYNAIKYSPEHTEIDLSIAWKHNKVIFSVKDQGIGIPHEDQKHIFQRYFRAENVLTTQGTGIGLNIVKHHIENLGGTIYFKSTESVGSTFTFELPL